MNKKGVPIGYKERWEYKGVWAERKINPGTWHISFRATKNRPATTYGNHPKGRRIRWKIIALQDVLKTAKGRYLTHMYGKKRLVRVGMNRLNRRR